MKKAVKFIFIFTVILIALFFLAVPPYLDNNMNRHTGSNIEITEQAKSLHQTLFAADLHNDALLWGRDLRKKNTRGLTDIPRLIEGNMALQGFSVVTKTPAGLNIERNDDKSDMVFWGGLAQAWPPSALGSLVERALMMADNLRALDQSQANFYLIRSQADLKAFIAHKNLDAKILGGWLTLEGAHALEGDLNNLQRLYDAGYRMIAPTHFFDTEIAGSAHGITKGGLTELGQQWVALMEKKSIIIDLAHISPKAFDDIIKIATRPVVVSHTGVRGTCDNNRNLSDEQIRAVANTGGLIGIGFWSTAVCGDDVHAIARAMIYTANLVGAEHVAIGSDYDGAVASPIDGTQLIHITQALLMAGMSEPDITKVMGANLQKFLLSNLPQQ
jgi:microsomal dipeptidase-like Zn-dependent dipeptidase